MGLFDKIFGQSNKIKVHFIDNFNGQTIGTVEMEADKLPETFEIATRMHIKDSEWTVEEAIPSKSIDFIKTKQLTLKLRKVEYINPKDVLFTLPTISNELPSITNNPLFNDFELSIPEDDWRQDEFLNKSSFPLIEIEVKNIKNIWEKNKKEVDAPFNAFDKCHVRATIGEPNLNINFDKLKRLLNVDKVGSLKLNKNDGFVKNSFVLKTETTTYYGILENQMVTSFCISNFSGETITEIDEILKKFNLIFLNWYNADIIAEEV